jgi:ATP-dependent Clp protease ATP-binding subunit ClpC
LFGIGKKKGRRNTFLFRATDRLRKVFRIVQQERRHANLSDESLLYLLSMIREGSGVGFHIIINFAKRPNELYNKVKNGLSEECNKDQDGHVTTSSDIIHAAIDASKTLGDKYVGTEHLLLGLSSDNAFIASQILHEHGLDFNSVKDAISRVRVPRDE